MTVLSQFLATRVEVESQFGVHTQLKTELRDIMKENAELKSRIKTAEAARVGMEVKKEASEKELKTVKAELENVEGKLQVTKPDPDPDPDPD